MVTIKKWSLAALAFLMILPGCFSGNKTHNKLGGLVVINVLDKASYDDCHIRGSIHVPFEDVVAFAHENIEKTADIVVYCSNYMCSASGVAQKQLSEQGFEHVAAYEGGTAEWFQRGYPVDGPAKEPYLQRVMQAPPALPAHAIDAEALKQKLDARDVQ